MELDTQEEKKEEANFEGKNGRKVHQLRLYFESDQ